MRKWFAAFLVLLAGCRPRVPAALHLSGTVEYTEHSVGARVPGRVSEIFVIEGQSVQKGDKLARLDRYGQAEKDYRRARSLAARGGATAQEAENARLALEDQEILAPVDGVVLLQVRYAGEVVPAGGSLVVIGQNRTPWVRVYVPEGAVQRVRMGSPATLRVDGLARAINGRVVFVAPNAEFTPRNVQTAEERVTQAFAVKVAIEDNAPELRPGISADVDLSLAPNNP